MSYFNQNHHSAPTTVSAFLKERLEEAQDHINNLTKGSFSRMSEQEMIDHVIKKHSLIPLKASKAKVTIDENKVVSHNELPSGETFYLSENNYRDVVNVLWATSGSRSLLGLRSNSGLTLSKKISSEFIKEKYYCTVGLSTNEATKQGIKERIEQASREIENHFDSINTDVEAFNNQLKQVIPPLVSAKFRSLNNLKSTEDFFNM